MTCDLCRENHEDDNLEHGERVRVLVKLIYPWSREEKASLPSIWNGLVAEDATEDDSHNPQIELWIVVITQTRYKVLTSAL